MDSETDLKLLRNSPSVQELDRITTSFLSGSWPLQLRVQYIITYLQSIIPIYESLKTPLRLKIRNVFTSTIAISNILNQYKLTKNEIYLVLIKDLLHDPFLLVSIVDSTNDIVDPNQIKSLFFGSKIYNTFQGIFELDLYLKLTVKQLVSLCQKDKESSSFFTSFLSIHPIESNRILYDEFLTSNNLPLLKQSVLKMTQFQKKQLVGKHLITYLSTRINVNNPYFAAKLLHQLNVEDIQDFIIDLVSKIDNYELQNSVSLVISNPTDQIIRLLKLWGLDQYINDTPVKVQELLTRQILVLLAYISPQERREISKQRVFLDSITTRLEVNEAQKRNFSMMIANAITNNEIRFDLKDKITVERLKMIDLDTKIDFNDLYVTTGMNNLFISNTKETTIVNNDSDDETDDEDYDEEQMPVFLKDLIIQFTKENIKSITKLLSHTIKLVRQKATFKLEIEFHSEELVSVLIGLNNKFEETGFEELKINSIVSVIVVNPLIISKVIELLFTGDYSLQQKMIILSSISLSARELRGLDDEFVEKPKSEFPTKQLPQRKMVQEIDIRPKIEEIKNGDEEIIRSGKITRISKKLTTPKVESKPNNFAKIAPKFFYPLANAWIDSNGLIGANHNELFMKHYTQTLDLIMHASYPCYGFEDMLELYNEIKANSQGITMNI